MLYEAIHCNRVKQTGWGVVVSQGQCEKKDVKVPVFQRIQIK